jgi:hypothetical protein
MAADKTPQTTTSEQATAQAAQARYRLARGVVVGSFLTLFLLVAALIGLAQSLNTDSSEAAKNAFDTAKNAFTAILPVLAGWVGTVLAFYFSAASHDRTSESLDKVISQTGGGPSPGTPVSEKMIPVSLIAGLQKLDDKQPKDITIPDLRKAFEQPLPNGAKVTRLIFLERGAFKYILHGATLNEFIVTHPNDTTFANMLADERTVREISKLVVFVSARTTLGEAKAALDKVSGAQDIIVTDSGNAPEPMLGWLSNIDLTKALQVN